MHSTQPSQTSDAHERQTLPAAPSENTATTPLDGTLPTVQSAATLSPELRTAIDACRLETQPLLLEHTSLGWCMVRRNEASPDAVKLSERIVDCEKVRVELASVIAEANPSPDISTWKGWLESKLNALKETPQKTAPPESQRVENVVLDLAAIARQEGRDAVIEIIRPHLDNTPGQFALPVKHNSPERYVDVPKFFSWLGSNIGSEFGTLAYRISEFERATNSAHEMLDGLAPGANAEAKKQSAAALYASFKNHHLSGNLWSTDKIEREVFLVSAPGEPLTFVIDNEIPSTSADENRAKGLLTAGRLMRFSVGQTSVPLILVSADYRVHHDKTTRHEYAHAILSLQRMSSAYSMTYEARVLDEMHSQVGDDKSIEAIRKLFNVGYRESLKLAALVMLDEGGNATNLDPQAPNADARIDKFLDDIEFLINTGVPRKSIGAALLRSETFAEFDKIIDR